MNRDYKLFINDIKESIRDIENYLKNLNEKDFLNNKIVQDAVIRRLEIIGEATKNIPKSVKQINKEIPWKNMEDFRDFITHSYFAASIYRVWQISKNDLPKIKENINKIKLL